MKADSDNKKTVDIHNRRASVSDWHDDQVAKVFWGNYVTCPNQFVIVSSFNLTTSEYGNELNTNYKNVTKYYSIQIYKYI